MKTPTRVSRPWVALASLVLGLSLILPAQTAIGQQGPLRVTVAQAGDVTSWDPPVDWNTPPEWIENNAYDCLLFKTPNAASFAPRLAERWERLNDLTMRFHLRRGVKFHDGSEFDAEDVRFHYLRIRDGRTGQYLVTPQYQFLADALVRDKYTIDIVTQQPDTLILYEMSQTGCGIVSRSYVQRVGLDGVSRRPMGTGPYRLKDWVKGERVVFESNPDYWGGKPEVDELIFRIIPEPSTRLAELLTGGIDLTFGMVQQDEPRIQQRSNLRAAWAPNDRGWMLYLRTKMNERYRNDPDQNRKFATEDPRVRRAIELAIDKYALRSLIQKQGEAYRARLFRPLPEASPELWGRQANLYNPAQARQILREAGYAAGQPRLVFQVSDNWPGNDLARAIADMLRRVGFSVDLKLLDSNTFNTTIYFPRKNEEIMLVNHGGNMNPFFGLFDFENDRGSYGYNNPRVNNLIRSAFTEVRNDKRRLEFFHQAQLIIAEDRPLIGLFQSYQLWGVNTRIQYTPRVDNHIYGVEMRRSR